VKITLLHHPAVRGPLVISLGAVPGALSRYYLTAALQQWLGTAWPWGTFVVNLSGAFLMGLFTTLAVRKNWISPDLRLMMTAGFLGSYTTFSTYQWEALTLWSQRQWIGATLYWLGSALLGLLCLELGNTLVRWILDKT
jgi:fluoride exporter